jgi:ABC-2 type transport system ATP-binding protein
VTQIAGSLEVSAPIDVLDAYVVGLGRAGVAVRHFERRTRSLESLFLDLTGRADRESAAPPSVDVEPLQESRVAS